MGYEGTVLKEGKLSLPLPSLLACERGDDDIDVKKTRHARKEVNDCIFFFFCY